MTLLLINDEECLGSSRDAATAAAIIDYNERWWERINHARQWWGMIRKQEWSFSSGNTFTTSDNGKWRIMLVNDEECWRNSSDAAETAGIICIMLVKDEESSGISSDVSAAARIIDNSDRWWENMNNSGQWRGMSRKQQWWFRSIGNNEW